MTRVRTTVLVAVSLCVCLWPGAIQVRAHAQELPTLTAPVNDLAQVIDAASAAELNRVIRVLQAATGDVVVVATVDTFAPYATIEEYAVQVFQRAGIGTRAQDSGALILLAVRDRRVRVEAGYGLEEFITDGFAGDTIRMQMLPEFREDRYGQGLVAGTTRIITRIAEARGVTLENVAVPVSQASDRGSGPSVGTILLLFIIFSVLSRFVGSRRGGAALGKGRGRSTWSGWHGGIGGFGGGFGSGGRSGGGFGGFGGGRSGGGGASGGW